MKGFIVVEAEIAEGGVAPVGVDQAPIHSKMALARFARVDQRRRSRSSMVVVARQQNHRPPSVLRPTGKTTGQRGRAAEAPAPDRAKVFDPALRRLLGITHRPAGQ